MGCQEAGHEPVGEKHGTKRSTYQKKNAGPGAASYPVDAVCCTSVCVGVRVRVWCAPAPACPCTHTAMSEVSWHTLPEARASAFPLYAKIARKRVGRGHADRCYWACVKSPDMPVQWCVYRLRGTLVAYQQELRQTKTAPSERRQRSWPRPHLIFNPKHQLRQALPRALSLFHLIG